jgi:hypothetical protein
MWDASVWNELVAEYGDPLVDHDIAQLEHEAQKDLDNDA